MPPAKAAVQLKAEAPLPSNGSTEAIPPRRPNALASAEPNVSALRPVLPRPATPKTNPFQFQARVPVITGEATYRGYLPIDGVISGQLTANGSGLTVKQRVRLDSEPELDGELSFRDLLRVNGHISGSVSSERGTLIVDEGATVDAQVEVGVAIISGVVNGDVVARERVELGRGAVINGNISTPLLSIKPGATFHGDCRMLKASA